MVLVVLRLVVLFTLFMILIYLLRRAFSARSLPKRDTSDPYSVLGISRSASEAEIKEAYHRELAKYHPDKVAHLGDDLQQLSRAKTLEIMEAYRSLNRR